MPDIEEVKRAHSQAMKILSRRDLSEAQLKDKLRVKGFSEAAVEGALARLKDCNHIDDARFALNWGRSRINARKIGARRLRQELYQKQLDAGIIEDTVNALFAEMDETALARQCADKKLTTMRGLGHEIQRRRLAQHLYGKGFDTHTVYAVLRETVPGGEDGMSGSNRNLRDFNGI